MAPHPASHPRKKEDNSSPTKAGIRPEIHRHRAVRGVIGTIINARTADTETILISMHAASGRVVSPIALFDVG